MAKSTTKLVAVVPLAALGFWLAVPSSASWLTTLVNRKNVPPKVVSVNGAPGGVTVRFSEKVRTSARSFGLVCRPAHPGGFTVGASPAQAFLLRTAKHPLRIGALCTLTVHGTFVHDLGRPPLALRGTYRSTFKVQAPLTPPKRPTTTARTTTPVAPVTTTAAAPAVTTARPTTTTTTTTTGGGGGGGGGSANHAPTDITLSAATVAENKPAGTTVGTLGAVDPDAGATAKFSLCGGAGDGSFAIAGNVLQTAVSLDFERQSSYAICIRATDNTGLAFEKAFSIGVADVNEAPTSLTLSASSLPENEPAGTTVGTLAAADPDAGDTLTFTLCGGSGDFTISGNSLQASRSFDFETKASYTVCVRATDSGGLTLDRTLTVAVTNMNEAPTAITLDHAAISENAAAGTTVGTLAATDPDRGDSVTFSRDCAGPDNASFAIAGTTLKTAAVFDFESKSSYTICVRATDGGGLSLDQTFVIAVTNVNEPPTAVTLNHASVDENQPPGTTVGTLAAADPDKGGSVTLALACPAPDNDSFAINGTTLQTTAGFDYERKSVYSICVRATDNGGLTLDQPLTISVNDVNEPPSAPTLTATSIAEHQPPGTAVGTLDATDPDNGDAVSFTLACTARDNSSFSISGTTLVANASFDYQTKQSYSICVRAIDKGGLRADQPFTITVVPTGTSSCTISQPAACENAGGTFITFTNVTVGQGQTGFIFHCTGNLLTYRDSRATITGSGWPVHLTLAYDGGQYDYAAGKPVKAGTIASLGGVSLDDGCTGDGDPDTIDLIVHIEGDGRTYGVQGDAFKLTGNTGPSNIQLTTGSGSINCGPRPGSDTGGAKHQDGIQVQSGRDIGFYGVTVGDWAGKRATCWGGGGAFFVSSANGHAGQNITVQHMRGITCNHGLNGDGAGVATSGSVSDSVFRTGRPSDRTDLLATIDPLTGQNTVGLCGFAASPVSQNVLAAEDWDLADVVGDGWSDAGNPWSPGFNPAYDGGL